MWNPLHEADSTFAAWRRPRWPCVAALALAAGLLIAGFLLGTGGLDSRAEPAAQSRVPGARGPAGRARSCGGFPPGGARAEGGAAGVGSGQSPRIRSGTQSPPNLTSAGPTRSRNGNIWVERHVCGEQLNQVVQGALQERTLNLCCLGCFMYTVGRRQGVAARGSFLSSDFRPFALHNSRNTWELALTASALNRSLPVGLLRCSLESDSQS